MIALSKLAGSTTEKVIIKTSVLGYARFLNYLYSSWPAVSLLLFSERDKFTIIIGW